MANEERKAEIEKMRRYWKEQIENWEASGLSQAEYCRRQDLKFYRFVYWRKKFIRPADPVRQDIVELPFSIRAAGLIPGRPISLRLSVGNKNYRIEVERDFDPVAFRQLVQVLGQI
jgi:hypothetical protein